MGGYGHWIVKSPLFSFGFNVNLSRDYPEFPFSVTVENHQLLPDWEEQRFKAECLMLTQLPLVKDIHGHPAKEIELETEWCIYQDETYRLHYLTGLTDGAYTDSYALWCGNTLAATYLPDCGRKFDTALDTFFTHIQKIVEQKKAGDLHVWETIQRAVDLQRKKDGLR